MTGGLPEFLAANRRAGRYLYFADAHPNMLILEERGGR
jgi:hypothetical protein